MLGVLVNVGTVLIGSLVGLLLKRGIPEKVTEALMTGIGPVSYTHLKMTICGMYS